MSAGTTEPVSLPPAMSPLDDAIEVLMELRRSMPEGANAELRMRGDDVFGRHLSVCYMRPKSMEELTCELPYRMADASAA